MGDESFTPFKVGQHVSTPVKLEGTFAVCRHHGIISEMNLDTGMKIIHWWGASSEEGNMIIRETEWSEFAGTDDNLQVRVEYDPKSDKDACAIVNRAREAMNNPNYPKFNLRNNNCEHFAIWCVTRRLRSDQVDQVYIFLVATIVAGIAYYFHREFRNMDADIVQRRNKRLAQKRD